MCVMPRSAQAMCALKLGSPSGAGLTASTPNMRMPLSASQCTASTWESGEVMQVAGRSPQAFIDAHLDQHRVALLDLLAGGFQRLLHLGDADFMLQRHMGKIEADCFGVEVLDGTWSIEAALGSGLK